MRPGMLVRLVGKLAELSARRSTERIEKLKIKVLGQISQCTSGSLDVYEPSPFAREILSTFLRDKGFRVEIKNYRLSVSWTRSDQVMDVNPHTLL